MKVPGISEVPRTAISTGVPKAFAPHHARDQPAQRRDRRMTHARAATCRIVKTSRVAPDGHPFQAVPAPSKQASARPKPRPPPPAPRPIPSAARQKPPPSSPGIKPTPARTRGHRPRRAVLAVFPRHAAHPPRKKMPRHLQARHRPARQPNTTSQELPASTIQYSDFVDSVAAALQYISYYHPSDYIAHLARAYEREQSPAPRMPSRRSSPTRACAPKASAPSARTRASSTSS